MAQLPEPKEEGGMLSSTEVHVSQDHQNGGQTGLNLRKITVRLIPLMFAVILALKVALAPPPLWIGMSLFVLQLALLAISFVWLYGTHPRSS